MTEIQRKFINNEIWTLTFGAAFQRVSIYSWNVKDNKKKEFKRNLTQFIESDILSMYRINQVISDDVHLQNIHKISEFTSNYNDILNNGRLNFGISQKLLNLLLKYQWCLFKFPEPPHFPLDRRIQDSLIRLAKEYHIKPIKLVLWTRMVDEFDYMDTMKYVRRNFLENQSLAKFELEHFERRRNQL